jgi:acyl carrier protein
MTTFDRLVTLLGRDFDYPAAKLTPDATLESLEIDSLRMIEIVFCVEEEFGVKADDNPAALGPHVKTLGDLATAIDQLPRSAST